MLDFKWHVFFLHPASVSKKENEVPAASSGVLFCHASLRLPDGKAGGHPFRGFRLSPK
jgi:hypothetical protein